MFALEIPLEVAKEGFFNSQDPFLVFAKFLVCPCLADEAELNFVWVHIGVVTVFHHYCQKEWKTNILYCNVTK